MTKSWDIFRTIVEFVRFSDAKAGAALAFAGGSAVFLASKADVLHELIRLHWRGGWGVALYAAAFGYLVSLLVTVTCALRSVVPSLGAGRKRSLIYFAHIARDFGDDHLAYAKAIDALDDAGLAEELAQQICANAAVASRKFELVGIAVKSLAIAIGFWGGLVFLMLVLAR